MDLKDFRKKLDELDSQLIETLSQRLKVSNKIAEFKLQNNLSIRDLKREQELIKDRQEKLKAQGIEDEKFASDLFNLILSKSRNIQNTKMNELTKDDQ